MRILLIEDNDETADYVTRGLNEHGHVVDRARDGHDGLTLGTDSSYDVIVIDRMLPKLDGLTLLRMLRAGGNSVPAIFLTAMSSIENRVEGLATAEDYLVKPFAFAELYARITALTRRSSTETAETTLRAGDLEVELLKRSVKRGGQVIELMPTEFRLLEYLLRHKGQVATRTMLLESVWEFHFDPKTNIVETHISRLRSKIDKGFDRELITTVRGAGYMIDDAQ